MNRSLTGFANLTTSQARNINSTTRKRLLQTETGTAESKPALTLRPVTDADLPFIRELYASTRNEEMATVPWTDEQRAAFVDMQFQAQLNHYREYYPGATHDLVLVSGRPVGR